MIWTVFIYKASKKAAHTAAALCVNHPVFSNRNRFKIGPQKFLEFRQILPIQARKHVCDGADIGDLFGSKQDVVGGEPQYTGEPCQQCNGKAPVAALYIGKKGIGYFGKLSQPFPAVAKGFPLAADAQADFLCVVFSHMFTPFHTRYQQFNLLYCAYKACQSIE